MDNTTSRLTDFAMAFASSPLPVATVHECKRRIIDTLACAFGAYEDPVSQLARNVATRYCGTPGASVWGSTASTSQEAAAFANGVMLRVLDLSDTYLGKSRGHPSDVISGIMAVGESVGASGIAVINAITLAYEIYCSFCDAIDINSRGWDQPVYSGFASAIGIGKLLGLTRDQMANAISLALTPNMAMYQTRQGQLSSWKGCASANAARNAVFAAMLARDGFTGPGESFEGGSGLWNAVGKIDWELPVANSPNKITQTHMKCFPICYHGQSSAWAAFQARKQVKPEQINSIEVATYRQAVAMMGADPSRWAPETRETADHSLPFVVATGLLHGEITSRSFSNERLADTAIAAIMRKVKVVEDTTLSAQYPDSAASRLTIGTDDNNTLVIDVQYPKGHANLPMDDPQVEDKFIDLFQQYGDAGHARTVLAALWNFDRMPDTRQLAALLSRSNPTSARN